MRKFLAAMAPVALMSIPTLILEEQFDALNRARKLVVHTERARALAAEIGVRAPRAPADAAEMVRQFAAFTADNPDQVATAGAMEASLKAGDLKAVSDLASQAASVESQLMVAREGVYSRKFDSARETSRLTYAWIVLAILTYQGVKLLTRAAPAPSPRDPGARP